MTRDDTNLAFAFVSLSFVTTYLFDSQLVTHKSPAFLPRTTPSMAPSTYEHWSLHHRPQIALLHSLRLVRQPCLGVEQLYEVLLSVHTVLRCWTLAAGRRLRLAKATPWFAQRRSSCCRAMTSECRHMALVASALTSSAVFLTPPASVNVAPFCMSIAHRKANCRPIEHFHSLYIPLTGSGSERDFAAGFRAAHRLAVHSGALAIQQVDCVDFPPSRITLFPIWPHLYSNQKLQA